jgi:hypothetical protein
MNNKNLVLIVVAIALIVLGFYYYKTPVANDIVLDENMTDEMIDNTQVNNNTIKPVPISPSGEILPSIEDGKYLIYYFTDGFSPNTLQIKKGQSVRFINKSDSAMRVYASNQDFSIYREFNQGQSVGEDGIYEYTFNEVGIWPYYNYNEQSNMGNILVY